MKHLLRLFTLWVSLLAATMAHALEIKPYSAGELAALKTAGRPFAVHFHADWCPTCVNQSKALEQIKSDPALKSVTVLVADFDKEKDLKREMKVRSQSTLVGFKGAQEAARDGGSTQPEQLRAFLARLP